MINNNNIAFCIFLSLLNYFQYYFIVSCSLIAKI